MTAGIAEMITSAFDLWGFTDEEYWESDDEPISENISIPPDSRLIPQELQRALKEQIFCSSPPPAESIQSGPVLTELTDCIEDLLLHPYLLKQLAITTGRENLSLITDKLSNNPSMRRQVAQGIVELFKPAIQQAITTRLTGKWHTYKQIALNVDERFANLGERIWHGGDRLDEERTFFRLLDNAPKKDQRILQRAWRALYQENREEATNNLANTLKFTRGAKAIFSLLEQEAPLPDERPSFIERIRQQRDGEGIGESLADTALRLADALCRPFMHLESKLDRTVAEPITLITQALAEEVACRLFRTESRTAALLMKVKMSILFGLLINRMQGVLKGYVRNFDELTDKKEGRITSVQLLQALQEEENMEQRLHPCIPVSDDPTVIEEWDQKFCQRNVVPLLEKLFLPGGLIGELLSPITGTSDLKLKPLASLIQDLEEMVRESGAKAIRKQLSTLCDPNIMNQGLIDGVESLFEWWRDDWDYIKDLEVEYRRECNKLKRVTLSGNYHHAQLALQTIVAIYVWTNKPGVVPILQGAACHLHSLLQDPQLIKNLSFHLIDATLFCLLQGLRELDEEGIHDLMGKHTKSQQELEGAAEPFNDDAMEELTDLLFYVANVGTKHMPEHSKWQDSLAAWIGKRAMRIAKKKVKSLVRSFAHWVVPVKGEVTAGRIVVKLRDAADEWLKSGALEKMICSRME